MKYINNKSISASKAKLIDFYSAIIGNFSLQLSGILIAILKDGKNIMNLTSWRSNNFVVKEKLIQLNILISVLNEYV